MSGHHVRNTILAIVASTAVCALAGAGLTLAMPVEPGAGHFNTSPVPGLPAPQTMPLGPGPFVTQQTLPQPVPAELRASAINAWVDAVLETTPEQEEDVWARIDTCVLEDMAADPDNPNDDTPAASIAVAIDGVITYTQGYGEKDRDTGGEVDENTLFRIGSTTKMMTAAAVMQLREQGKVDLNEGLPTYLPEYQLGHPWQSDDISLHLLMSHQSGILDQYFVPNSYMPLMSWVQAVATYSVPLYAAPGSFWNYSNPNFSLAGAVVERLGGQPYNDYMSQQVWDPAGMPLTTLDNTEVISHGNYATGYNGDQPVPLALYDMPMLAPAGTAFSTPSELVTWTLMLQSEEDGVLSGESKRLMQTPHVNTGYMPWYNYGYGVMIHEFRDTQDPEQYATAYEHGGNIHGGSSQLFWVPERGVSFSILSSTIRSLERAAYCTLDALAHLELVEGEPKDPSTFDDFVGTYSMMDVFQWPWTGNVRRVSDTLTLGFNDIYGSPMLEGGEMPLYYAFEDVFVAGGNSVLLGAPGRVDLAFMRDADTSRVRYMRNRNLVGQRVGQFPERVEVVGDSCTSFDVTSELDMPMLSIRTSGLITPTLMMSVPLAADDPQDPGTSSLRYDIEVGEGGLDMAYVWADTEPDDAVGLYLTYDANGDGEFTTDEIVSTGIGTYGTTMLYLPSPAPAGNYQLWVWGVAVNGEASLFDLHTTIMQGDHLRLENRPRGLIDGADWTMEVCADDIGDFTDPMTGMIEFSYDSPPRLFRVMVDWVPATEPEPVGVFLPYAVKGAVVQ